LHGRHFPDLPGGEITIEGTSQFKHCTKQQNKEKSMIKMGFKKERRALFNNTCKISCRKKKEKRNRRNSGRTVLHGFHFPDLPFGEITIEVTSFVKHCTTAPQQQARKVQ